MGAGSERYFKRLEGFEGVLLVWRVDEEMKR